MARSIREIRDLPSPRGTLLLGNARDFDAADAHLHMERWARELGSPYRIRLGPTKMVVWSDHEVMQQVMRARPEGFRRGGRLGEVLDEMGLGGVFAAEGEAWVPQRKLIVRALASQHMSAFYPTVRNITQRFHQRMLDAANRGQVIDLAPIFKAYALDVISALAFGIDTAVFNNGSSRTLHRHLSVILQGVTERMVAPIAYWRWFRQKKDREIEEALHVVHAHARAVVDAARATRSGRAGEPPAHLLDTLLDAADEPDSGVTEAVVIANILTLLLASEDTTASSMAWAIPFIAGDRALQDRLHASAVHACQTDPVCPSLDQLDTLDLVEATIQEAQRLKPTVGLVGFNALREVVLDGVRIPADTLIYFVTRNAMTAPKNFTHPTHFDPTRWLKGHSREENHEVRAFMQFGAGARVCPGRALASMEMRSMIAMLVRNFTIELDCKPSEIREVCGFTVAPSQMPVRLMRRA